MSHKGKLMFYHCLLNFTVSEIVRYLLNLNITISMNVIRRKFTFIVVFFLTFFETITIEYLFFVLLLVFISV